MKIEQNWRKWQQTTKLLSEKEVGKRVKMHLKESLFKDRRNVFQIHIKSLS